MRRLLRRRRAITSPPNGARAAHSLTDPSKQQKLVQLSKEVIDFNLGEGACPLNETVRDVFTITNNTGKKLKFEFDPIPNPNCKITFEPASGTIGIKQKKNVKRISVRMVLLNAESLNFRVNLRINDGETLFLTIRTQSNQGVFGVDPSTLEMEEDLGFHVPRILVQMKNYMIEQNAWQQEGIFRLAGEAGDIKSLKQQINKTRNFDGSSNPDVNSVANLLKIWYRDLPTAILNEIPPAIIGNSGDANVCVEAYEQMKEPYKSLLGWLLAMIVEVAAYKDTNKMTEQNLAIVIAPNLYNPPGSDPMEGLVMSQKSVQFLHHLVLYELETCRSSVSEYHPEEDDAAETFQ
jgi:hypothetical protein